MTQASGEPIAGAFDPVIRQIADYVCDPVALEGAVEAAHLPAIDALACALLATADRDCRRAIRPPFAAPGGTRVVGTTLTASPVDAAFATGTLIRWLDFNDTWLAQEWGHPSDNLGGLLPLCDHLCHDGREKPPTVADLLTALAQAYEVQGSLALETALNRHGLDHTAFVRVANAAVATRLLGGDRDAVASAVAHAFTDGGPLRVYRHAPNVTWRKSWAAGDAVARGLRLADHALRLPDAPGTALTTPQWGLQEALLGGEEVRLPGRLGTRVVEAVLLKPAFPAEYHGQSAVEAALALHRGVAPRLEEVRRIDVHACEAAVRIIDKPGPLAGHADRDHCLQYMVAAALVHGELDEHHYGDEVAADPRLEALRGLVHVYEEQAYTRAYHDPDRRAVPARLTVHFDDRSTGAATETVEIWYPIGHPRRRAEAQPHVVAKLARGLGTALGDVDAGALGDLLLDLERLRRLPVSTLVDLLVPGGQHAPLLPG